MTVIAFDGKTLAADKLATSGGMKMTVTKLFRARGCLIAASGDFDRINESVAWFAAGADPAKMPPYARDNNDYVGLLVIDKDGSILKYERSAVPFKIESPFIAIGSGREYAMAAMHLGKSAAKAVEVACALDANCGNGVDTMMLEVAE
jgi:hypothetical protein